MFVLELDHIGPVGVVDVTEHLVVVSLEGPGAMTPEDADRVGAIPLGLNAMLGVGGCRS